MMWNIFRAAGISFTMDGDRLKVEGLKQLPPDQAQEIRQKIQGNRDLIIYELQIPAPEPAGLGPEYESLWNRAWLLADWIDNPDGAPIEDRVARLPELMQLRDRLAVFERQTIPTVEPDPATSPKDTWMPWESTGATTRDQTPDICPARCKRSGRCYGRAWFTGKPAKSLPCIPEQCAWDDRFANTSKKEQKK